MTVHDGTAQDRAPGLLSDDSGQGLRPPKGPHLEAGAGVLRW